MEQTFRASMNWLHTWTGVVLGALLFAVFWMGTLSVFDREIDRWMMPMSRLAMPAEPISFDKLRPSYEAAIAARSSSWFVTPPTEREPTTGAVMRDVSGSVLRRYDPVTGAPLTDPGTRGGTGFLFPFHFNLHLRMWNLGAWLVGLAGMAMLAMCVSGVIVHRRIFADFFTFRSAKKPRRLILDLHNVVGVLGLPFHVAITLSGLLIFFSVYFPGTWRIVYQGDQRVFTDEAFGTWSRPKLGEQGSLASLDAMVAEARRLWAEEAPYFLRVWHPGDRAAYVEVRRSFADHVDMRLDAAYFDAATGRLLHRFEAAPIMTVQRFFSGLHFVQFRHWTLRWLYFGLGLTGCVLIATGFLFWLESRRREHAVQGLSGVRVVEGLTVGATTGIVIATLAFFIGNRLLPPGATFLGQDRAALEIWAFYLTCLVAFGHAWLRPRQAWCEQLGGIALLALAAVSLNWMTTGDHLVRSLSRRHLRAVGGMDLVLLIGSAMALLSAVRLCGRRTVVTR